MKRIAVLVSGGGTNLQALIDYEKSHQDCPYVIALVISDRKDVYALTRASSEGIPVQVLSPYSVMGKENAVLASRDEKRLCVSNKVLEVCKNFKIEALVQAGYLTVLSGNILKEYENNETVGELIRILFNYIDTKEVKTENKEAHCSYVIKNTCL